MKNATKGLKRLIEDYAPESFKDETQQKIIEEFDAIPDKGYMEGDTLLINEDFITKEEPWYNWYVLFRSKLNKYAEPFTFFAKMDSKKAYGAAPNYDIKYIQESFNKIMEIYRLAESEIKPVLENVNSKAKYFGIIFNLTAKVTKIDDGEDEEENPEAYTIDIDKFMKTPKKMPRYKSFLKNLEEYTLDMLDEEGEFIKQSCKNKSIIAVYKTNMSVTKSEIYNLLKYNSLEDGEYESEPGSNLVYPVGFLTNEEGDYTRELALIDYRDNFSVYEMDAPKI